VDSDSSDEQAESVIKLRKTTKIDFTFEFMPRGITDFLRPHNGVPKTDMGLTISRYFYIFHHIYLKEDDEVGSDGSDPLTKQSSLLAACVAASVQNKSALGDRAGKYVRKLGIHPLDARTTGYKSAAVNGFSLHGGVLVEADDRKKLEHLIRYVARPSIALERLNWTHDACSFFADGTSRKARVDRRKSWIKVEAHFMGAPFKARF